MTRAALALLAAVWSFPALGRPAAPLRPTLAVVVVVDQLGAGMLEEVRGDLRGGFRRFLDEGLSFTECRHDHAGTETGPGHATLLSGLHPSRNGIVLNEWYDPEAHEPVYCAGAEGDSAPSNFDGSRGVSAARLLGENLADLMKRADPGSKVYAVSGKDRAAVLAAGHRPDGALWYSFRDAGFTSHPSIMASLPAWGTDFWGGRPLDTPLYREGLPGLWRHEVRPGARPDDDPHEDPTLSRTSPHPVTSIDPARVKPEDLASSTAFCVFSTPWLDWLTLQLAGRLVDAESLGTSGPPDLLIVALSATDTVGHRYGPGSQEHLDQLLRLDGWLGEFMGRVGSSVEKAGGSVLFALGSDHGVMPLPETLPAGRRVDEEAFLRRVEDALQRRLGEGPFVEKLQGGHLYLDRRTLKRRGIERERAAEEVVRELTGFREVARSFTADLLAAPEGGGGSFLDLQRNSFRRDRSGDVVVQLCEGCLLTSRPTGTSHGSPYDYDRRVPMILLGAGVPAGRTAGPCRTVDLAPTLASALGLPPFDAPRDGAPLNLRAVDRPGGRR